MSNIQNLADAWAARPRRQIEFDNVEDLEWLNALCRALIPAMPEIQETFGVQPKPMDAPIILQMPPPEALVRAPARGLPLTESNQPSTVPTPPVPAQSETPASQKAHVAVAYAGSPSKHPASARERRKNSRIPKQIQSKDGTAAKPDQTKGKRGKSEVVAAKPPAAPEVSVLPARPSNLPPAMQKLAGDDAPLPKLTPIG